MCAQRRKAVCQNMSTKNAQVADVLTLEQRFVKNKNKTATTIVGKWSSHNEVDMQTSAIKHNAGACASGATLGKLLDLFHCNAMRYIDTYIHIYIYVTIVNICGKKY